MRNIESLNEIISLMMIFMSTQVQRAIRNRSTSVANQVSEWHRDCSHD